MCESSTIETVEFEPEDPNKYKQCNDCGFRSFRIMRWDGEWKVCCGDCGSPVGVVETADGGPD